ncbi:MAG: DUF1353 domain-containing protein [Parvularculaceae bacterium]|nr:DUF1353 domain-containing protein [Parvularculaceae bacterium]
MPYMIDDEGLCLAVLEAAKGAHVEDIGPDVLKALSDMVWGAEDRFLTDLVDQPVRFEIERRQKNSRNYVVRRGLVYIHVRSKPNVAIIVPPHFVTDHASVPYVFRWIVAQSGKHSPGAVLHDWLYTVAEPPADAFEFRKERFRADRIFLEALRTSGVSATMRSFLYRGARLFGASGFGAKSELRFIDPRNPDRLVDPALFDKAVLRKLTIIPRPETQKPKSRLSSVWRRLEAGPAPAFSGRKPAGARERLA